MPRELPLLRRELTAFGRRRDFYAFRAVPAVVTLIILLIAMKASGAILSPRGLEELGNFIGNACLLFQYGVALLGAPIWAAEITGKEREDRTLPLLLLADFRGGDILLAKFAGAFGPAALLIVGTAPLTILAATGRIAPWALFMVSAHAVALAALGAALGIYWSLRIGNRSEGARAAVLASAIYGAVAVLVFRALFHTGFLFPFAFWWQLRFLQFGDLMPLAVATAASLALAVAFISASFPLLRSAAAPRGVTAPNFWTRFTPVRRPIAQEQDMLAQIMDGPEHGIRSGIFRGIFLCFLWLIASVPLLGNGVVAVLLAYHLCVRNARLMESPMLDELRLTHFRDEDFAESVFRITRKGFWLRGLLFMGTYNYFYFVFILYALTSRSPFATMRDSDVAFVLWIGTLSLVGSLCQSAFLHALAACMTARPKPRSVQIGLTMFGYAIAKGMGYFGGYCAVVLMAQSQSGGDDLFVAGVFIAACIAIAPLLIGYFVASTSFQESFLAHIRHVRSDET